VPAEIVEVKVPDTSPQHVVIGQSVEGRTIDAYTYGRGATRLGFVGGMHGGYEWNSILLAYDLMDYLSAHPEIIPANLSITVIPDANPDGVYKVLGTTGRFTALDVPTTGTNLVPGRYNADTVDLNRNFACNWQATSTFLGKVTSAGSSAFSEPEARAIRDFVLAHSPKAMVFLHSKSGAVYASECNNGILPKTLEIMNVYARAAGYQAINVFDAYTIHGDSEGWLASIGIPAITVELTTHNTVEWEQNLAGIKALFGYYK
jgi:predicted deacylase